MSEKQNELYLVTAIDIADTCDGHATPVYACKTSKEALDYVKQDMEDWINRRKKEYPDVILDIDWDKHVVVDEDTTGCIWDIHVLSGIDISKKWFETQNNIQIRRL